MLPKKIGLFKDESNKTYGRWKVLDRAPTPLGTREAHWWCVCDCGKKKSVSGKSLRNGQSTCCGQCSLPSVIDTAGAYSHYLYDTWSNTMRKCYDAKNPSFKYYGALGIKVFEEWHQPHLFYKWIDDNLGARPRGFSLDRINVYGHYEPGNLRWANAFDQVNNRRLVLLSEEEYRVICEMRKKRG